MNNKYIRDKWWLFIRSYNFFTADRTKSLRRVLPVLLFFPCLAMAQEETTAPLRKDSMNCYLNYPIGYSKVFPEFGNNPTELSRLDTFLHRVFADTLLTVRSVRLTGHSSVEGAYKYNARLAENRARGMQQHLDCRYNLSSRYPVSIFSVAEDWDSLRNFVATSSSYPWREEVLAIIDRTAELNRRKELLMSLDGGAAYKCIFKELFPRLRRVEVRVDYDLRKLIERQIREPLMSPTPSQALASLFHTEIPRCAEGIPFESSGKERCHSERSEASQKKPRRPVIGLSTNLLADAGLAFTGDGVWPDYGVHAPMPNLGLECFFAKRFSLQASALYANWDDTSGDLWAVTAVRLEPRFWFSRANTFQGVWVGLYGQAGDFDVQSDEYRTGWYWQSGVAMGYYFPFTRHWGVGAAARGGYQYIDRLYYAWRGDTYRLTHRDKGKRWGVTELELTINYRF